MRLKLTIAYDGRPFLGWQSQVGGNTVQDLLHEAIESVAKHPLRIHGSGRTDTGVHALGLAEFFRKRWRWCGFRPRRPWGFPAGHPRAFWQMRGLSSRNRPRSHRAAAATRRQACGLSAARRNFITPAKRTPQGRSAAQSIPVLVLGATESGEHCVREADGEHTRRRVFRAAPPLPGGRSLGSVLCWDLGSKYPSGSGRVSGVGAGNSTRRRVRSPQITRLRLVFGSLFALMAMHAATGHLGF